MRKIFSLLAIILILSAVYFESRNKTKTGLTYEFPSVEINKSIVKVEVADDFQEQLQGLSNRTRLNSDAGMLFVFSDKQERTFWMKQMNFPIDILWISDNKIVNISKNLAPEGEYPKNKYSSQQKANYVLEVNAGFAEENQIKIGDIVKFNNLSKN